MSRAEAQAGEITFPDYLPQGEFRVEDRDGYALDDRAIRTRHALRIGVIVRQASSSANPCRCVISRGT